RKTIKGRCQLFFSARLYFRQTVMIIDHVQPLEPGVRSERRQVDRFHPGGQIEVRHELAAVNEAHIEVSQREEYLAAPDEMSDPKQRLAIKQHSLFHISTHRYGTGSLSDLSADQIAY